MFGVSTENGVSEPELPQFLWSPPDQQVDPPVETKPQLLPVDKLSWPHAEGLFLRLLARTEKVPTANLFGTLGQAQDGIDIYARVHSALSQDSSAIARPFVTLQSKRVKTLTARAIGKAVDKFLEGQWAERSEKFYYATSHTLQPTQLDDAVRTAEERLGKRGIEFVPWGIDRISELLKSEPDLVDDFFSREWVRLFCGADVADNLADRLTNYDFDKLRNQLSRLYRSVFKTQDTGVANYGFDSTGSAATDFIVLDGIEMKTGTDTSTFARETDESNAPDPSSSGPDLVPGRARRRRSTRQLQALVRGASPAQEHDTRRERLDTWLINGRLSLLVGEPGSGKSSFLRFLASNILSENPQSDVIARQLGRSLPIWLPFSFLSSHLAEDGTHSVLSAVRAWLSRHDSVVIWPLVERAMDDDRLLLIVDGLDEWTDLRLAEAALAQLETFLDHRENVIAVSSTRPYALNVLAPTLNWRHTHVAPLTRDQQRAVVERVLSGSRDIAAPANSEMQPATGQRITAQVDDLLNELESVRHIEDLARYPLFLVLLASVWRGEPLPSRRFDIYRRLVKLLIIQHPQMRRRSSQVSPGELTSDDVELLWAAVAFRLRRDNASGLTTRSEMRKLVVDALMDETVLDWTESRAGDAAETILTTAEQHFGLLVSHGTRTIGFLHRVLYEHLAGLHLATLPLGDQIEVCSDRASDPAWRDVVLSTLSAQTRPTDTKCILDDALQRNSNTLPEHCRAKELLAEAIACGVTLTPRDLRTYIDELVTDVEESPWQPHRLIVLKSLTGALASRPAQEVLTPVFIKWMRARTAEPGDALVALRHTSRIGDDTVWRHLVWGLRHVDESVQLDAAELIAQRFGADQARLAMLMELANNTDSPQTAAAIVHAAAIGWPHERHTTELITWARKQQSVPLRIAGIRAYLNAAPEPAEPTLTDDEKRWLIWLFRHERLGGPWERIAYPLVPLAVDNNHKIADECLRTLIENDTTSWDRQVAWVLGCHAFAHDARFRGWVITELRKESPLIMYPVSEIPGQWGEDPAFREAVVGFITRQSTGTIHGGQIHFLSALVPSAQTRDALIACIDGFDPTWMVRALLRDYPNDPEVQAALANRFDREPSDAINYSYVAVECLGLTDGIAFLRKMLAHDLQDARSAAVALAAAWSDCQFIVNADIESGSFSTEQVSEAQKILSSYDAEALAQLCLDATSGVHELYCSDHIVLAWPTVEAVRQRAMTLLNSAEARPGAVIAAYADRSDPESSALTELALSQLGYLEPGLREALAAELGAHSHDPLVVTQILLDEWTRDYDRVASRASAITLSRSLTRATALLNSSGGAPNVRGAIEKFYGQIESEMTALGKALDERRQVAWIAMLITGRFDLLQTAFERRRAGEPARVPLQNHFGETDQTLAGLVAQHWEDLERSCPGSLFDCFGHPFDHTDDSAKRQRAVWSHLSTVARSYPVIADRLRSAIAADDELRADPRVVEWLAAQESGVEALRALLATLEHDTRSLRPSAIDLIESIDWPLSPEDIRKHILAAATRTWKHGDGSKVSESSIELDTRWRLHGSHLMLFAELYPRDPLTVAKYEDLRNDLNQHRGSHAWTWPDVITLAVNAAQAGDLPMILLRTHGALVAADADQFQPTFLTAVSRRLRSDPEALAAIIRSSPYGAEIPSTTDNFLAGNEHWVQYDANNLAYWRSFFFTKLLDGCRLLGESGRAAFRRRLPRPIPSLVVHDPILFEERILNIASTDLLLPFEPADL
jgi:hypothetical protein